MQNHDGPAFIPVIRVGNARGVVGHRAPILIIDNAQEHGDKVEDTVCAGHHASSRVAAACHHHDEHAAILVTGCNSANPRARYLVTGCNNQLLDRRRPRGGG